MKKKPECPNCRGNDISWSLCNDCGYDPFDKPMDEEIEKHLEVVGSITHKVLMDLATFGHGGYHIDHEGNVRIMTLDELEQAVRGNSIKRAS